MLAWSLITAAGAAYVLAVCALDWWSGLNGPDDGEAACACGCCGAARGLPPGPDAPEGR
jgi:hypothetical protein